MIYYIQDEASGLIKIGFAEAGLLKVSEEIAMRRLRELQTGCPGKLHLLGYGLGDREEEQELHKTLAFARERGEWFRPVPVIIQMIAGSAYERGCRDGIQQGFRQARGTDPNKATEE